MPALTRARALAQKGIDPKILTNSESASFQTNEEGMDRDDTLLFPQTEPPPSTSTAVAEVPLDKQLLALRQAYKRK